MKFPGFDFASDSLKKLPTVNQISKILTACDHLDTQPEFQQLMKFGLVEMLSNSVLFIGKQLKRSDENEIPWIW